MADIIIYTTEETLFHKQGLKQDEKDYDYFYWEFRRLPKHIDFGDKIYFAHKGFIRGYFIVFDIDRRAKTIEWDCKSWVAINPISVKHFQGFKYYK